MKFQYLQWKSTEFQFCPVLTFAKIPNVPTLEAIYENGIFKPISSVPETLKEHERVCITVETDSEDLQAETAQWETASDGDFLKFEESLEENR